MEMSRQLSSRDRYNVSVAGHKLFGNALHSEWRARTTRTFSSPYFAIGVATRLNQNRQPRGEPVTTVDHLANIACLIDVAFIKQQIRMLLAFISSGHYGGPSSNLHVTVNGCPVHFDCPMRRPTQQIEPACGVPIRNRDNEQACRGRDRNEPSHRNIRHQHTLQCS